MMPTADFPFIYRFRAPAGLRGQRCRRIQFAGTRRDRDGMAIFHDGSELVTVEFPGGRIEVVSRSAIVSAESRLGRMTVARLSRGDVAPWKAKRQERAARQ